MVLKEKKSFALDHSKPFENAAVGGTFDHIHEGHHIILETAFSIASNVLIGLTTKEMFKNKPFSQKIQSYEIRKNNIIEYLTKIKISSKNYEISPLKDGYGPTISSTKFDALVCSTETYPNALKINEIRQKRGLPLLTYIVIPMILNEMGERYSSTKIRADVD